MEIKAELLKPYSEEERIEFIAIQNRQNKYIIEYRKNSIVALDYTIEEKEEIEKINKINEINRKIENLNQLSLKEIRQNNLENVKVINQIINGLEETKRALE